MKKIVMFFRVNGQRWIRAGYIIMVYLGLIAGSSCQKMDDGLLYPGNLNEECDIFRPGFPHHPGGLKMPDIYFGPRIFKRGHGSPAVVRVVLSNSDFECYDGNFVLRIINGISRSTRVTSAEITIDGKLVAGPSDFSRNVSSITKKLTGLNKESVLEVRINGAPWTFIDLWIEGTKKQIVPVFDQIGPLCQNSLPPNLPLVSSGENPVEGTWSPAVINTSVPGTAVYTFTPSSTGCVSAVKMEITVTPLVVPLFEQIGPLVQGSVPPALPAVSENGIQGTWTPAEINTMSAGTSGYSFTPEEGQCASPVVMNIEITAIPNTVTDIDGNVYKTVKIGDQVWMAENLKVTRYRNGDPIGTTIPATLDISAEAEPKYQWAYNGDESNVAVYGRLYTWYAVTDPRGACPAGWHVPTINEWYLMEEYLKVNGFGFEGSGNDIAKSLASSSGWTNSATPGTVGNDQATNNKSGFNGYPGGVRLSSGSFTAFGDYAAWMTSSQADETNSFGRALLFNITYVTGGSGSKKNAGYVRCQKD